MTGTNANDRAEAATTAVVPLNAAGAAATARPGSAEARQKAVLDAAARRAAARRGEGAGGGAPDRAAEPTASVVPLKVVAAVPPDGADAAPLDAVAARRKAALAARRRAALAAKRKAALAAAAARVAEARQPLPALPPADGMAMLLPAPEALPAAPERGRWWRGRMAVFAGLVLLPTLLGGIYAFGIAADIYVAEAQFWVRGQRPAQASILGGLLGAPGLSASPEEAVSVRNYAQSHDAVIELQRRVPLRDFYARPEADWLRRLPADASLERLVEFHRRMVEVVHDDRSGITTLRAYAFRPDDARRLAEALLLASEELVNTFSLRSIEDSLRLARAEVEAAERRASEARDALEAFRDRARHLDPSQSAVSVLGIVSALEGQLAQLRAEIQQKRGYMREDNPALAALRTRAAAVEQEIARERSRLTGEAGAIAGILGNYERLTLQREFADRGLTSALASLEQVRVEAQRQQLYLVRVVQPQQPEEAIYPRRWLILLGVACGALVAFAVGALGRAAIRDHMV